MVIIDGSHGDGGGSIVRAALTVATLTQQPVRIDDVRSNGSYPGLDIEDIVFAEVLGRTCNAEIDGEVRSSVIGYRPRHRATGLKGTIPKPPPVSPRNPSASLIVAGTLPVLQRAETMSDFSLTGETHGRNSLSYIGLSEGVLPALAEMGLYAETSLDLAGFGRESSGKIVTYVEPGAAKPLMWDRRGPDLRVTLIVETGQLHRGLGERAEAFALKLAQSAKIELETELREVESRGPGYHVTFVAEFTNGRAMGQVAGQKNIKIETAVQRAFEELSWTLRTEATTDPFLADHLVIPMCFSGQGGAFTVPQLTSRLLGIIWTVKQFSPMRILVKGQEGEPGSVTVL